PRVAALLDVMQVSDIVKVIGSDTFERLIYAGNAVQTVRSKDKTKVITVRTSTFQATGAGGAPAPIEEAAAAADPGVSTFVGEELSKSERPELTSAKIIISGGRAMQSRENFTKYIEPVADKAGQSVGAAQRAGRRQARRGGGRFARGSRCRLCAQRLAGRPDRQGCGARALHRSRDFRRDPASRRHEGFESHRGHQQGRRGADLPGRRLWTRCRSLPGAAGIGGGTRQARPLTISACATLDPWSRDQDRRRKGGRT